MNEVTDHKDIGERTKGLLSIFKMNCLENELYLPTERRKKTQFRDLSMRFPANRMMKYEHNERSSYLSLRGRRIKAETGLSIRAEINLRCVIAVAARTLVLAGDDTCANR